MLSNCKQLLKRGDKLILWEETFVREIDYKTLLEKNSNINILTNLELTKSLYNLSVEQRWEFIIINDWLINVKNSHMPWTGEYRSWDIWVELLNKYGFNIDYEYNCGLRINGKLKQGVYMMGQFKLD